MKELACICVSLLPKNGPFPRLIKWLGILLITFQQDSRYQTPMPLNKTPCFAHVLTTHARSPPVSPRAIFHIVLQSTACSVSCEQAQIMHTTTGRCIPKSRFGMQMENEHPSATSSCLLVAFVSRRTGCQNRLPAARVWPCKSPLESEGG